MTRTPRPVLRVVDVAVVDGFKLALSFSDGTGGVADLAGHLTDILEPLKDPAVFAQAHTEAGTVSWNDDIDVDAEFLYALAHKLPPPVTGEDVDANHRAVSLRELRQLAGKTQVDVAGASGLAQSEVSRIESRSDVLLSTLRRYVEALGGELEVIARVGDQAIVLRGIGEVEGRERR